MFKSILKRKDRFHILTYVFIGLFLVSAIAWAAYSDIHGTFRVTATVDDSYTLLLRNSSESNVATVDTSGNAVFTGLTCSTGAISAGEIADVVRYFELPLTEFMVENGNGSTVGTSCAPLTASTTPGMEIDDNMAGIVWADGETSPIQITFRVPDDYASGGAFKVVATESNSTTANEIDFDVYVQAMSGVTADASATGQTPVAVAGDTCSPAESTLSVTTDFAALVAGSYVTLRLWRDDTANGTGDLELKSVAFYYTATQ